MIGAGLDPDTYVPGNAPMRCAGCTGGSKVLWASASTRPRVRADQAKCTPDIAYRSVMATYRAGGHGIVLSPNYASMHLTNLDGVARPLTNWG